MLPYALDVRFAERVPIQLGTRLSRGFRSLNVRSAPLGSRLATGSFRGGELVRRPATAESGTCGGEGAAPSRQGR